MTQYFFVDESGDAGLDGQPSSSSHFAVAMVQIPERTPFQPIANLRQSLNLPGDFEFKYHTTKASQKERFFKEALAIPFRIRAATLSKVQAGWMFRGFTPEKLTMELIVRLALRSSELDISNDVLIVDGATPAFCRGLRVYLSEEYKRVKRIRPFKILLAPIPSTKTVCNWRI